MNTISISNETVYRTINMYLTGMLESITCSCSEDLKESNWIITKNWTNSVGQKVTLSVPSSALRQAYMHSDDPFVIDWVKQKVDPTFAFRLYKWIKDID